MGKYCAHFPSDTLWGPPCTGVFSSYLYRGTSPITSGLHAIFLVVAVPRHLPFINHQPKSKMNGGNIMERSLVAIVFVIYDNDPSIRSIVFFLAYLAEQGLRAHYL